MIGPRQSGKTTLIWSLLASLQLPTVFIDCEIPLLRSICQAAPLFLDAMDQLVGHSVALFFDEAQHLEEAGIFVKGLVDRRPAAPIFVSGSAAFHMEAKTRESLAGRAMRTTLYPFSLGEVSAEASTKPPLLRDRELSKNIERHIIYGGYPEVWLMQNPKLLLTELVEALVSRDASDFFKIARPDAFRKLLRLAALQVGNLVNISEWASICAVNRDTLRSYIEILESTHVVQLISPFVGGKRAELKGHPKLYFIDSGIRNQLVGDFNLLDERADKGQLLEGWVFGELRKAIPTGATIHFWRSTSGAEVDFVVQHGKNIAAIEVKATPLQRPKITRSARSFLTSYRPRCLYVINTTLDKDEVIGSTPVHFRRPHELGGVFSYL
ncbi:MAG: ATP-binding protein [Myxococcota bacterium]|nr:ATP-binding protein [Myxococcota bacterium]